MTFFALNLITEFKANHCKKKKQRIKKDFNLIARPLDNYFSCKYAHPQHVSNEISSASFFPNITNFSNSTSKPKKGRKKFKRVLKMHKSSIES